MILHRYFARRFMTMFFGLLFVMFALAVLVGLVDHTRGFGGLDVTFGEIFALTLLGAPTTVNQILPLIVILATVALFVTLARSSELVVTRATGRSPLATLSSPVAVVIIIGLVAVAVFNPIVAATSKKYNELSRGYLSGGTSTLSISEEGLWLRQAGENDQTVISARRTNENGSTLFDVSFMALDENGPFRRIDARQATLEDGYWRLTEAKEWPIEKGVNSEAASVSHAELDLPSTLTLDRIRESLGQPNIVPIWDLPSYIDQLESAGFSTVKHQVYFQTQLARPLFLMAMLLVAAAFTMRPARSGGTGVAVLSAILLGFGLYFIRSFAHILGDNEQIPVLLAAWAPPFAALFLAVGLILHAEDG